MLPLFLESRPDDRDADQRSRRRPRLERARSRAPLSASETRWSATNQISGFVPADGSGTYSRLRPLDESHSTILYRMSTRVPCYQMPPIGTRLVDEYGRAKVAAWIKTMTCRLPVACAAPNGFGAAVHESRVVSLPGQGGNMGVLRFCILLASCCATVSATADESSAWRALYREGSRQYDLGDFRAALDAFKRAYLAHEEAGILFDIAECHRQLGENVDAVHAYQSYLRRKPDAANRADVEALVVKLHAAPAAPPLRSNPSAATSTTALSTPPAQAAAPPAPPAPAPVSQAPHGTLYNPWGATAAMPPPAPAASQAEEPGATSQAASSASALPSATPAATMASAPAWAPTAVEAGPHSRTKSRAWIAAIVVPAVTVLAVSIGITAWYFSPSPTFTKVGPAQ